MRAWGHRRYLSSLTMLHRRRARCRVEASTKAAAHPAAEAARAIGSATSHVGMSVVGEATAGRVTAKR
jgi:hypothetical protein